MPVKTSLYFGRVSGIKIFIHWTFLILIAWIVLMNLKAGHGTVPVLWSLAFIFSIFGCVVLHELGHALTAQRYKIKTIDITLYPIGGVARMEKLPDRPKEELLVALAGPMVNLVIAGVLLPFARFSGMQEIQQVVGPNNFLTLFISVNVWLALFNLLPAFPMDGGRVLRALLSFWVDRPRATRMAAGLGQLIAIGFVFVGFFVNPFLIFIGLFIFLGAQSEVTHAEAQSLLNGHTIEEIVMANPPVLPPGVSIQAAARQLVSSQIRDFLILDGDALAGTLGKKEIIKAIGENGEDTAVAAVMDKEFLRLPHTAAIETAWQSLLRQHKSMAVVFKDRDLMGVVDLENIAEFIMIREAQLKGHR